MKKKKTSIILAIMVIILFSITIRLIKSSSTPPDKLQIIHSEASEGNEEDPVARARFNWMRLRDPATNKIPKNIGVNQYRYAQKLAKQNTKNVILSGDWSKRGPHNIGGRTKALALDVKDENTILAGGVSSGMWKSTNGGSSWYKTTAPTHLHSVSCIAQNRAEGKEHIWYYGTGEWGGSGRGGSAAVPMGNTNIAYRGDGIFKSTDNGETWDLLPSTVSGTASETNSFDFVWRLITFGENGVYAATSTGLYKSTTGGNSWDHVLDLGEIYTSADIAMTSDSTIYAAVGGFGPNNGIYRSTDGEIWENISPPDWPDSTTRTVIAIAPSNEKKIFFYTCQIYWTTQLRKYEEGVGWTNLTATLPNGGELTNYSGNMLIFYVKPDDENTFFLGTVGMYRSKDGGENYETIGAYADFHVDQHAIVFYPSNPKRMIVGNDGGLFRTEDNIADTYYDPYSGDTIEWESLNNGYLTTQFYTVGIDHKTPGDETIIGGMQDNGCMYTQSLNTKTPWIELHGGDGGYSYITHGGRFFYTNQGAVFRVWKHTFENGAHLHTLITPTTTLGTGIWLSTFIMDKHDEKIMYLPWRRQLWRNSDVTEIPWSFPAVPTDSNWTRLEHVDHYTSALGMSEAQPRRLYFGTLYGDLFVLDNPHTGQPEPTDIKGDNFPVNAYIHCIAVDPRDANKVLVVFPNYNTISIYASEDGGTSWKPVSGNLEENFQGTGCGPSVRWVSVLYIDNSPVYLAGTSVGLFFTTELDSMNTTWFQESPDKIGNLVIDMIDVRQSDGFVAIGTHGNGVYSTYITGYPTSLTQEKYHPSKFQLLPSYPNPFNQETTIQFVLKEPGLVQLKIYNILGKEMETLLNAYHSKGKHRIKWKAHNIASGTYIIRFTVDNYQETQKVVLVR